MANCPYDIQIVTAGGPDHLSDLGELELRGIPLTHQHASWCVHDRDADRRWIRVLDPSGTLVSGFCVGMSRSALLPWAPVGRVERLGRRMHAPLVPVIGPLLSRVAAALPRLLWLEAQVFDEDAARFRLLRESLVAAGARRRDKNRSYSTTLLLPVGSDRADFMRRISSRARRKIREFDRRDDTCVGLIQDRGYVDRMKQLYRESFHRTGAAAPPFPAEAMLEDAAAGGASLALGAFVRNRPAPDDLVGFVWSRCHGDYISYDVAASDRSDELGSLAPGYALVRDLADWGRKKGAGWLDLGGISTARAGTNPRLRGIHAFKQAFWSEETEIAAEYELRPASVPAAAGRALLRLTRGT